MSVLVCCMVTLLRQYNCRLDFAVASAMWPVGAVVVDSASRVSAVIGTFHGTECIGRSKSVSYTLTFVRPRFCCISSSQERLLKCRHNFWVGAYSSCILSCVSVAMVAAACDILFRFFVCLMLPFVSISLLRSSAMSPVCVYDARKVYEFPTERDSQRWREDVDVIRTTANAINAEARRSGRPSSYTSRWHDWLHVVSTFRSKYGDDFVPEDIKKAVTGTLRPLRISREAFERHRFPGRVLVDEEDDARNETAPEIVSCCVCQKVLSDGEGSECARCRTTVYCSKPCQIKHWKEGGHKEECNNMKSTGAPAAVSEAKEKSTTADLRVDASNGTGADAGVGKSRAAVAGGVVYESAPTHARKMAARKKHARNKRLAK